METAILGAIVLLVGLPVLLVWLATHPHGAMGPSCKLVRLADVDSSSTRLLYTTLSAFPDELHEAVVAPAEAPTIRSRFRAGSWIRICDAPGANRMRIENLGDPAGVMGTHVAVHDAPFAFRHTRGR